MTKKQALRDLQTRLAVRLQSAQAQAVSAAWLAVSIAGRSYLLPLSQSGEIFPVTPFTRVPYTQPWFCGVANLRGGLFGVVDLVMLIDPSATTVRTEPAWAQARLVTLNAEASVNCALVVDSLLGLRRLEAFKSAQPAPAGSPSYFGQCFLDSQDRQWQEIDLYALSQTPAFLSIGN